MNIFTYPLKYPRHKTKKTKVGNVQIGGQNHVVIQSMTTTKTHDTKSTIRQIKQLASAGAELVRVAVFDEQDAQNLKNITALSPVPIIADIHFNYRFAILAIESGCKKIRLNPGNIQNESQIKQILDLCKKQNIPIRIGVNCGSLPHHILKNHNNKRTAEAMIDALKYYLHIVVDKHKFTNIIISLKSSNCSTAMQAYSIAANLFPYPLHLGITEAGPLLDSSIKSAFGLGFLLKKGIGDTIRISITDNPIKEIIVAKKLLHIAGLRKNCATLISCPTCGRLQYEIFSLVKQVNKLLENYIDKPVTVAVMGCVVNGVGEVSHADIGVFATNNDKAVLYIGGKQERIIKKNEIIPVLKNFLDNFK